MSRAPLPLSAAYTSSEFVTTAPIVISLSEMSSTLGAYASDEHNSGKPATTGLYRGAFRVMSGTPLWRARWPLSAAYTSSEFVTTAPIVISLSEMSSTLGAYACAAHASGEQAGTGL